MTCTTLLHHSLPVRVCGVSSEAHDQYQIFDRSSLELLLDMLEKKFCCYLSLAEYDPAAFVLFFRFFAYQNCYPQYISNSATTTSRNENLTK